MEKERSQRVQRIHKNESKKKKKGLNRFLNSPLFITLGSLLLLIGLYSSLSANKGPETIYELLMGFLAPSSAVADGRVTEVAGSGLSTLLLYFLQAIVILAGTLFFARNYRSITLPIAVLTCFYVYISVFLLSINYTTRYEFLFTFILLFGFLICWVANKIEKPVIQILNFIFITGFFGLYWLRKLVVNARTEFLPLFFTFGILAYLLFYAMVLYNSGKKENPLPKWIQLVITGSNLAMLLGSMYFVFMHYFTAVSMGIFVAVLLLLHVVIAYFLKKYRFTGWTLPHVYTLFLLASLALPLLILHYRFIIFSALFSVLMLWYAIKEKEKSAMWFSVVSLIVMLGYYSFAWINTLLPAIFSTVGLPDQDLLLYGLLMGIIVVGALFVTTKKLQKEELPSRPKWFKQKKYDRSVRLGLHLSIFITMGWLSFMIVSRSTLALDYTPLAWFFSGTLFFIGAIYHYSGRNSSFKKPILYLALAFAFLYPFMVHVNMIIYLSGLIMKHEWNGVVLVLHYLSLALVLILGRMIIMRIHRHHRKNINLLRAFDVATVLFILFILCTEYDNLTTIMSIFQRVPDASIVAGAADPLSLNKFLPYSLVTWILASVVFCRAMVRRNSFMRNFAIILFTIMLVKLFTFDFETLSAGARSTIFVLLGIFLIGFAFIYPKLLKGESIFPEFKRSVAGVEEISSGKSKKGK